MISESLTGMEGLPPPEAGWRARLLTGITWNLMAVAFAQGSTFAINIVFANVLGRQIFGEYAIIRASLLTLAALAPLATGYTATRYVAEFRSTDRARAGRVLGICTVVSTAAACVAALSLLAGASWLATHVLRAPHLRVGFAIVSIALFFSVMSAYQVGALAGLESYRALAMAGMISGVVSLAICGLAVWVGGLNGALAGLSVSASFQWMTLRWFLAIELARRRIVATYRALWLEYAVMVKFALPAALAGFVSLPALWLGSTFLVRQPGGYDQMALYGAANSFRMMVLLMPAVINNVGMSVLGNQRAVLDEIRYRQVFWANMGVTAGVVLLGALTVILFGPQLLMMFGRGFGESYAVLVVLMLSTIAEGLGTAVYQMIQADEKMWLSLFAIAVPRDGGVVVLSYLLAPSYGALGLAVAQSAGAMLALLTCVYLVRRIRADRRLGTAAS